MIILIFDWITDTELGAAEASRPERAHQQSQDELAHPVTSSIGDHLETRHEDFYMEDPYYLEMEESDLDPGITDEVAQNRQNRPPRSPLSSPSQTAGTNGTDFDFSVVEYSKLGENISTTYNDLERHDLSPSHIIYDTNIYY